MTTCFSGLNKFKKTGYKKFALKKQKEIVKKLRKTVGDKIDLKSLKNNNTGEANAIK